MSQALRTLGLPSAHGSVGYRWQNTGSLISLINTGATSCRTGGTDAQPSCQEGRIQFIAEGIQRLRIGDWFSRVPPYLAEVSYPKSPEEDPDQVRAYGTAIVNTIKELLPLNPLYGEQLQMFLAQVRPSQTEPFADFAANLTTAPKEELQDVL